MNAAVAAGGAKSRIGGPSLTSTGTQYIGTSRGVQTMDQAAGSCSYRISDLANQAIRLLPRPDCLVLPELSAAKHGIIASGLR